MVRRAITVGLLTLGVLSFPDDDARANAPNSRTQEVIDGFGRFVGGIADYQQLASASPAQQRQLVTQLLSQVQGIAQAGANLASFLSAAPVCGTAAATAARADGSYPGCICEADQATLQTAAATAANILNTLVNQVTATAQVVNSATGPNWTAIVRQAAGIVAVVGGAAALFSPLAVPMSLSVSAGLRGVAGVAEWATVIARLVTPDERAAAEAGPPASLGGIASLGAAMSSLMGSEAAMLMAMQNNTNWTCQSGSFVCVQHVTKSLTYEQGDGGCCACTTGGHCPDPRQLGNPGPPTPATGFCCRQTGSSNIYLQQAYCGLFLVSSPLDCSKILPPTNNPNVALPDQSNLNNQLSTICNAITADGVGPSSPGFIGPTRSNYGPPSGWHLSPRAVTPNASTLIANCDGHAISRSTLNSYITVVPLVYPDGTTQANTFGSGPNRSNNSGMNWGVPSQPAYAAMRPENNGYGGVTPGGALAPDANGTIQPNRPYNVPPYPTYNSSAPIMNALCANGM